jgi:hypothetical protein
VTFGESSGCCSPHGSRKSGERKYRRAEQTH